MTSIRRFMEASAILLQKLYAHLSEHAFDQGILGSPVATHLDVGERVLMQTSRIPNPPIERSAPSEFVRFSQAEAAPLSHVTESQPAPACRQIEGGIQ
jgi:hypothetical protein